MANQINYYYVYFNIRDFSNSPTLSSYTLPNTPLTFFPDFDRSFAPLDLENISTDLIRWDFGDGTFSNSLTATHWYQWPGDYKVTLTVYDRFGNAFDSSYNPEVNIYNYLNDQVLFNDYRKFIYDVQASKINDPLTVKRYSSWQSYNALSAEGYTLNLYASGAAGDYLNVDNFFDDKWSHLRTLSRFYEKKAVGNALEFTPISKITTSNEEIFVKPVGNQILRCDKNDQGSVLAGTTGQATFYYADDRVKNYTSREMPIFLYATVDNSKFKDQFSQNNDAFSYLSYPPAGYLNIKQTQLPIIKVRHNPAYRLSITTTGIDGEGALSATRFTIPEISWQNTQIPFVVRFKDIDGFTTKTYPPLSSSVTNPTLSGLSAYNLQFGLISVDKNTGEVRSVSATFYDDFDIEAPRSIGGFYKGYFVTPESATNCALTASIIIRDPTNFPKDSLFAWVALPEYKVLLRFFSTLIYSYCPGYLTLTISADQNFFDADNNRNVYAIQIAPSGNVFEEEYNTWFGDGASDRIFKLDNRGALISSFALSSYPYLDPNNNQIRNINLLNTILSSAAPGSFALDGLNDLWIALFDSGSAIKIDRFKGYIKAVAYPSAQTLIYNLSSDYNLPSLSGFAGEQFLMPSSVETDTANNVWVTYTNPASNFLVRYTTNGIMDRVIPLPWAHSPVELLIDRDKNVWLTTYNLSISAPTIEKRNDYLYKFNYDGELVYTLSGFKLLGNIAVDGGQNIWVVEGNDLVTRIDRVTYDRTSYKAGSGNNTEYIQSIGGIACDTSGFLWVINDYINRIIYIDTLALTGVSLSSWPYTNLTYPVSSEGRPVSAFEERRWQAYGDWLGSRWLNKYIDMQANYRTITGRTNFFNIYPDKGEYNIYKVNEDFDAKSFYKSLVYTESLQDKPLFFDKFLGSIVGGLSAQPYELGKTIYEKIANYVSNNADLDLANIEQLISFCDKLSIQFEQYNYPYPPQLRRLVNILSIKQKKLWGSKNKFNYNFNTQINPGKNLGTLLSTLTSKISSGKPIIAYEKFSSNYTIVNRHQVKIDGVLIPANAEFPLSSFNYNWGWGLVTPNNLSGYRVGDYYNFFTLKDGYSDNILDNVIDWSNSLTTLNYSASSYEDWSKDDGIMHNILSYELSKGLRLFLSGSDIVYNN